MLRRICIAKIQPATVTETALNYEGSITLDKDLVEAAGLLPGEMVQVLNLNNGSRIETYVIVAEPGSDVVCLNGPAARCGEVGDKVIVLGYAFMTEAEISPDYAPRVVILDEHNRIKEKRQGSCRKR